MSTTMDAVKTTQVYRVWIKASPQKIWDAITQPDWTEKYGYRTRSEYDLRPGGSYRSYANDGMRAMGAPEIAVDGEVIECDPPRRLVQTFRMLLDPTSSLEGFTRLTHEIEEGTGGVCKLTVIHDLKDAPRLAVVVSGTAGDGAGGGWSWILSDLKSLLETGQALDWQS
ncbi:MAG TPA: SRPBCC domain-containing protein [Candidatus Dormibacteraeota bacterium]|jgi:uncharacterized protein YndB with AHSA1/START domain|nr:SRPBCC domain-containing protein [Candidatus Dormibacteraeota bacterium]